MVLLPRRVVQQFIEQHVIRMFLLLRVEWLWFRPPKEVKQAPKDEWDEDDEQPEHAVEPEDKTSYFDHFTIDDDGHGCPPGTSSLTSTASVSTAVVLVIHLSTSMSLSSLAKRFSYPASSSAAAVALSGAVPPSMRAA